MNLIQVLLQLMVAFGGRNSTAREISAVLSVVANVAHILMSELQARQEREAKSGSAAPAPFTPGHWDELSQLVDRVLGPTEQIEVTKVTKRPPKKRTRTTTH